MSKTRDIWNDPEWVIRRLQHDSYIKWYDGVYLDETMPIRDRDGGGKVRKFPLDINIVQLGCDIHRDIARGSPANDAPLVVRASLERSEVTAEEAEKLEHVINEGVWRPSHGGPLQQEALLSMNIHGGTVLKLSWEPWDVDLPFRLAIRHIKNPGYILPTWDYQNPWRLLEVYIGYEITPVAAKAKYGVTVPDDGRMPLYMEHWTPAKWEITIDDVTPTIKWGNIKWQLKGQNPWGFVPVYYIPHQRTTDLWGRSQVDGQEEITKDLNSRVANISDIVRHSRPGILWGHDLERTFDMRRIQVDGQVIERVLDVGKTRNIQGSQPPGLASLPTPDIPDALISFPQVLLDFWMMLQRISPATFGMDDTSSGRITGPAIANRMWTSMAHGTTERINFSEGKTLIDRDITTILAEREQVGAFRELKIEPPGIKAISPIVSIKQNWPPMIPMDRKEQHDEMIESLKEGGMSIEEFLEIRGVEDIEGEKERIAAWLTEMAEIKAKESPPNEFGGPPAS